MQQFFYKYILKHFYKYIGQWYKAYITKDSGIWVGNGVSDQYLIRLNSSNRNLVNNCGDSFGYVIKQEEGMLIKLIGMKDAGDENG